MHEGCHGTAIEELQFGLMLGHVAPGYHGGAAGLCASGCMMELRSAGWLMGNFAIRFLGADAREISFRDSGEELFTGLANDLISSAKPGVTSQGNHENERHVEPDAWL